MLILHHYEISNSEIVSRGIIEAKLLYPKLKNHLVYLTLEFSIAGLHMCMSMRACHL